MRLPYRLRLGVTGHRDLVDPAAVAAATHRLLARLERVLGAEPAVRLEWTIVSPLAKGADRVVARTVLEHGASERRPELEAITPLPIAAYRTDFDTPADVREFDELLARCTSVTELNAGAGNPSDRDVRNRCYLDGGKAVVHACEVLIAVWDGEPAQGGGGTAEVVAYALERGRAVLWIPAGTGEEARLLRRAGASHRAVPVPDRVKRLSPGLHQLASFLRDGSASAVRVRRTLDNEVHRLRDGAEQAGLPLARLQPVLDRLTPYYARADTLATLYQRRHTNALRAVVYLAAVAASAAAFQAVVVPGGSALTWIEFLSMIGILAALGLTRWSAWHEKWRHDRYLAEHLRTASHALVLGDDPAVRLPGAADVLPFYAGPQSWLPAAIQNILRQAGSLPASEDLLEAQKRFIADVWLRHQRTWHASNAARKRDGHRARRRIVVGMFLTGLALAVFHLLPLGHGDPSPLPASVHQAMTFLSIVLPAWAAAIHAMGRQLEVERIAVRSKNMARVLERLALSAREARTTDELRVVVREATRVVALENHEWSVLLSFVPPELGG